MELITSKFHNFDQLHSFRNNLSHPDDYEDIVNNFELVKELRESSKVIVSEMLKNSQN